MTHTPETDALYKNDHRPNLMAHARKLERERDEWKEMYIQTNHERGDWKARYVQQNKDLGCEMMDPNGTIWDHAKTLQEENEKLKGTLKVIHTWATFRDGIELVPDHVAKLTAKALNLTKTTP